MSQYDSYVKKPGVFYAAGIKKMARNFQVNSSWRDPGKLTSKLYKSKDFYEAIQKIDYKALKKYTRDQKNKEDVFLIRKILYYFVFADKLGFKSDENNIKQAEAFIVQLKKMHIPTEKYETYLSDLISYKETLPYGLYGDRSKYFPAEGASSISPRTVIMEDAWKEDTLVVPQNKFVFVEDPSAVNRVVTYNVQDCIVLTFWDKETGQGGLAHLAKGSDVMSTLAYLMAELHARGMDVSDIEFNILGGNYSWSSPNESGDFIYSSQYLIYRTEQALYSLDIKTEQVQYDVMHDVEEKEEKSSSNIGLDLATGEVFYIKDPKIKGSVIDLAEYQDKVVDMYCVDSVDNKSSDYYAGLLDSSLRKKILP